MRARSSASRRRRRTAATSSARTGSRWSPSAPSRASASTSRRVAGLGRGRLGARAGQARRHRPQGLRQAGRGRRAPRRSSRRSCSGRRRSPRPSSRGSRASTARRRDRRVPAARADAATSPLPILGRVGEVTAEMIEEDPEEYQVGDIAGISGLQARYDDTLRGTPGLKVDAVDVDGGKRELFRTESRRRRPAPADHGPRPADRGRVAARGRRPGQRAGGAAAQHRRDPGRGQRAGQRRHQPGDVRAVRARLDVQDRLVAGAAPRRV